MQPKEYFFNWTSVLNSDFMGSPLFGSVEFIGLCGIGHAMGGVHKGDDKRIQRDVYRRKNTSGIIGSHWNYASEH